MDRIPVFDFSREFDSAAPEGFIPLCVPEIGGNEWKYVKECIDTGWVSSVGPFVDRFERQIAAYVDVKHAVAVVNGTAALHTALKVVGLQPGEEVIVSNLTFVAPVNAIHYCQAYPLLMDADPLTWQMDTRKLEEFLKQECKMRNEQCVNKRTERRVRAIVPVHLLGLSCEIDKIVDLARQYQLLVVEDAAEGLGVRYGGRHVGTFGDIGVLSFNGNKIITAGGGGMLITNNAEYADYARYLTTQAKDDPVEYIHNEIGYNYRLSNVQAALGLAQLEHIDEFIAKKHAVARSYRDALSGYKGITLMPTPPNTEPTYWLYTVLLPEPTTLGRRKTVIKDLNEKGIGARPFWHTVHDLPPYRKCQAFRIEHSTRLYERGVSLPCSVGITEEQLARCTSAVRESVVKRRSAR